MPLARVVVLPRVDVEDPGLLIPDVAELAEAEAVGVDPRDVEADADKPSVERVKECEGDIPGLVLVLPRTPRTEARVPLTPLTPPLADVRDPALSRSKRSRSSRCWRSCSSRS